MNMFKTLHLVWLGSFSAAMARNAIKKKKLETKKHWEHMLLKGFFMEFFNEAFGFSPVKLISIEARDNAAEELKTIVPTILAIPPKVIWKVLMPGAIELAKKMLIKEINVNRFSHEWRLLVKSKTNQLYNDGVTIGQVNCLAEYFITLYTYITHSGDFVYLINSMIAVSSAINLFKKENKENYSYFLEA